MTPNSKVDQEAPALEREPITTVGNLARDMLELVERPVITWRPDRGDAKSIAGMVVGISTTESSFGAYPIIEVDDGTNVWTVHALGQVFAGELDFRQKSDGTYTTKLAIGDVVAFSDSGQRIESKTPGRSAYRSVRVIHRPAKHNTGTNAAPASELEPGEIPF